MSLLTSRTISLRTRCAFAAVISAVALSYDAKAEDWHRITSADGKASVLFPIAFDESTVETTVDKTPAGKATTRVLGYQDEGMLFTISTTDLPGLAVKLAGEKVILKQSKNNMLGKAFSKETSFEQYAGIAKPTVMVLKYNSANLEEKDHPGFTGLAVLFIIDNKLYVVNTMLRKGQEGSKLEANLAKQTKLLDSIKITP